jgi:CTP:phosphocholine cytidylyltransferase-like protein
VIERLLTVLAQKKPDLIVVLAGYEKEMMQMLESNPGMKGRFPHHFKFKDYDADELMQIACHLLKDSEYVLTPEAEKRLKETIEEAVDRKDAYFHNARWVEQYIQEGILTAMSDRLMSQSMWMAEKRLFQTIEVEDVEKGYRLMQPETCIQPAVRKRIGFVA